MSNPVDIYLVLEIIRRLSTPFTESPAFKAGLIDDKGNLKKPRNKMTNSERRLITYFDLMIFNIKKIISRLPGGDSKLKYFALAALLLKEQKGELGLMTLREDEIVQLAESLETESHPPKKYSAFMEMDSTAVNAIANNTIDPKTIKIDLRKKKRKPYEVARRIIVNPVV